MQVMGDVEVMQGWCAPWSEANFVAALTGGGDSRLAVDPALGTNRYFVPPRPVETGVCLSSCTASPISQAGFRAAKRCYVELASARTEADAASRLTACERLTNMRLADYLGVLGKADVVLLPSGTDGILFCSILLSLEAGSRPLTAILPAASETGAGVPRAAMRRAFDGPHLCGSLAGAVEIPLRKPDGSLRDDDEVSEDYRFAAHVAAGRPVIYQTFSTKTGLVAPLSVPSETEVVVDACQMRVSSAVLLDCLRRGWPVVVTGSKFLGGPPFSAAVLLPTGRFGGFKEAAMTEWRRITGAPPAGMGAAFGPLLRWVAAMEVTKGVASPSAALLACHSLSRQTMVTMVRQALGRVPGVKLMPGPSSGMLVASRAPESIFSFAVSDPARPDQYLSAAQLQPLHTALAHRGVLLGQSVDFGRFGVLRVAFGARDGFVEDWQAGLERAVDVLDELVSGLREPAKRTVTGPALHSLMVAE